MIRKQMILENLNCANCASKIEDEVNQIEGLNANVNFMNRVLTLEAESDFDFINTMQQVQTIVHKHEPDIVIAEKSESSYWNNTIQSVALGDQNRSMIEASQIDWIHDTEVLSDNQFGSELFRSPKATDQETERTTESASLKKISKTATFSSAEKPEDEIAITRTKKQVIHEFFESTRKKQLFRLSIGGILFGAGMILKLPNWQELILFLLSYLIAGGAVIAKAIRGILRGQVFSENFLMSIATIGAFSIGEYPEGVAVMLFYLIGEIFEEQAIGQSRNSISAMMDIRPDYANLVSGDEIRRVSPETLTIGDVILVYPGEKIPLDGKVISGISLVDTAALTGESVPRELKPGSEAFSGFVNKNGVLTMEVTKNFGESTVSKILDLVQNAGSRKAPTEQFITKFARYYTPVVVFGALALALLPPLIIPGASYQDWIYRALVFLVISCPCAFVISIPLGFFGGIGGASKRGILVKGGNYLEALNNVEMVVFDKTGTLTKGVFNVVRVNPQPNFSKEDLIRFAAYAECHSNHPIGLSILKSYQGQIDFKKIQTYEEIAGNGLKVTAFGKQILVGNAKFMIKTGIPLQNQEPYGTIVYVAVDQQYAGNLVIADEIKEDAASAIQDLKTLGIKKTILLSGDSKPAAEDVASRLGLDVVFSELLPADKVEKLEMLESEKSKKGKIVFVGDGINDAPVLARADIGMAMGGLGSDAAIEAADIVLMTDEPSKIVTAIKIARKTRRIVVQNLLFAFGVKILFLTLGAFGVASMWEAVFGDTGVAVIAILNSMRVMNTRRL